MEVAKLTIPQLRVLEVLYQSGGVLSRGKIASRVDKAETYVGRVIGYSDPEKRARFRETPLGKSVGTPLLDQGYVQEIVLDIDGLSEIAIRITDDGVRIYRDQKSRLREFLAARNKPTEDQDHESDNREERTGDSDSDEQDPEAVYFREEPSGGEHWGEQGD